VCYHWFTTMKSSSVHKVDKYPKLKELLPFIISLLIVKLFWMIWFRFIVFNTTFYNISVISWRSVLLVEETRVLGENHRPVACHWQTLSHNVVMTFNCRYLSIKICLIEIKTMKQTWSNPVRSRERNNRFTCLVGSFLKKNAAKNQKITRK